MSKQRKKIRVMFAAAALLILILVLVCCSVGRYQVSPSDVVKSLSNYLFGSNFVVGKNEYSSVVLMRLPRTLMAVLVGASLSISGCVYQSVFNNKLVSPDMLGVTGGSCVGASLAILFGASSAMIMASSFVFGIIAVCLALALPVLIRNTSNLALVLSGIIVSAIFNSALGLIKYTVDSLEKLETITFWVMGSLSGVTMNQVNLAAPFMLISIAVLLLLKYRINIVSLGESESSLLGVRFRATRGCVIICATILTSCSTAVCGTISWIGLIIPHIARLLVGSDNRYLLPFSTLMGAAVVPVMDTLCRTLTINEIPISIISSAFGALVFVIILLQKGNLSNDRV